jgi:DNA repair protein RadC
MYTAQRYRINYVKEACEHEIFDSKITHKLNIENSIKKHLSDIPIEKIIVLALDAGNKICGYIAIEGTTNQCAIFPKNVFTFLLSCGASSFVMAHNHPGGSINPSEADWKVTRKLLSAGECLDIPLLDHLILGDEIVSMRENVRWGA